MGERGFRPRQKGIPCKIEGCDDWRVSNDLCPKHNMALHRYGNVHGKLAVKKRCKCGVEFEHKYKQVILCEKCRKEKIKKSTYEAVKKWRHNNPDKAKERDSLGKRTRRRFGSTGVCVTQGCGKKAEAHHPDYDKPYEIVWLCRHHHRDAERGKPVFKPEDIKCDTAWKEALLNEIF